MSAIPAGALALLREWLPPDDDPVRPTMQLATVDATGGPDVRTVLLSAWDERGFAFHTDAMSRKAGQLAGDPRVAAVVLLPGRQLVVRGAAEPQDGGDAERAYAARTPYLRRLAWLNTRELAQEEMGTRHAAWARDIAARPDTDLQPAPSWAGWVIRPDRLTFWTADPDGPSHRVEHRLEDDGWTVHHLPG